VEAVGKEAFDVILLDIRMTNMDGIEALGEIRKISPQVPVLIMTAYASVKTAVEALKAGAFDYLTKPLDIEELKILIEKAMDHYHLRAENLVLKERLGDRFDFSRIIATSPKMKTLLETLAMVAPSDATVLIMGESGTGKEVVANAIHHNSPRAGEPFIKVACAALPETLLESELFGHEKGAFTGAVARREGRFQLAHRGTIFLDEVGEMSPALQTKLLRVLQEKEFEPLGGTRTVKVDIRVITATNRDLDKEVEEGRFREDLYYRLNVIPIEIPPLRDRRDDVPLLIAHFLRGKVHPRNGHPFQITRAAMEVLCAHNWPGNVRELENAVERATVLCEEGLIRASDLPHSILDKLGAVPNPAAETAATLPGLGAEALYPLRTGEEEAQAATRATATPASAATAIPQGPVASLKTFMRQQEQAYLNRAIQECDGDKERAALLLGISLATLYRKLSGEAE